MKKIKLLEHTTMWMNLENIIQKGRYERSHMIGLHFYELSREKCKETEDRLLIPSGYRDGKRVTVTRLRVSFEGDKTSGISV